MTDSIRRAQFAVLLLLMLYIMADVFSDRFSFGYFSDPTKLFWFGILPLLLLFAYGVSLFVVQKADRFRTVLVLILSVGVLAVTCSLQMILRDERDVSSFVHDGAVQTEEASRFLLRGVNPYTADYQPTSFGEFKDVFSLGERPNPAWDHYVYLPGSFLIAAPFQWFFEKQTGWFDVRVLYLALWIGLLLLFAWSIPAPWRDLAIMIVALNPFTLKFTVAGLNDITLLFFLYLGTVQLFRKKYAFSAGSIALALLMKHSAWLFLPFYLLAFWQLRREGNWKQRFLPLYPAAAVVLFVLAFFFFWSPGDFYEDVWRYANGAAEFSYPASGLGLSKWLVTYGVIDQYAYFPFWIFTLSIGVPVFLFLLRRSMRGLNAQDMFWHYGFALFGFWFFARYFNDSHIAYLAFVFLIAAMPVRADKKEETHS